MAGDWIKMRGNLWDDPRVSRLVDETDSCEAMVVGALYWLWATADQHSEDGVMPGLTLRTIDRKTGIKGLGDALVLIGWLADHPEGVRLVRFDEHNGESAKRRCVDAKRKSVVRKVSEETRTETGHPPEDLRENSELEKEKEKEVKTTRKSPAAPTFDPRPDLAKRGVSEQTANDWIALRKSKKAIVTVTALQQIIAEANKARLPLEHALAISCRRGWAGFEAGWLKPEDIAAATPPKKDWI